LDLAEALADGFVTIENAGSPDVCLIIDVRRFPWRSVITRRDVEAARSTV
jgi:hypothetical protein